MNQAFQRPVCGMFIIAMFGFLGSWIFGEDKAAPAADEFTTPKAVTARKEFSKATTNALRTCNETIEAARKRYAEELAKSVKLATKIGDFKEAQRLQAVIDNLGVVAQPATPTGSWKLRFSHSGDEMSLQFDGKGNVNTSSSAKGTVRPTADDWIVEFANGGMIRLNPHGARFFVEQWENKVSFQNGSPAPFLAVGTRL